MKKTMTEAELRAVPVPAKTDSYSPVPHGEIIDQVKEQLYAKNIPTKSWSFKTNSKGTQVIGLVDTAGHKEFDFRIAFRNSYDKSMSVAFVAGASVMICSNGMIVGDVEFIRKHTGSVLQELKSKIQITAQQQYETMKKVEAQSNRMKSIMLDKTATAELCGRFFMEQDIINSTQLNIIKKELDNPSYQEFSNNSLWSLYNHTTHALKESHPLNYMDSHKKLHEFVTQNYAL